MTLETLYGTMGMRFYAHCSIVVKNEYDDELFSGSANIIRFCDFVCKYGDKVIDELDIDNNTLYVNIYIGE